MQLLDVEFRLFARAGPDDRSAKIMNLKHMLFCPLVRKAEDAAENKRHIAHQINRVVMDNNVPRRIKRCLLARFSFRFLGSRHDSYSITSAGRHQTTNRSQRSFPLPKASAVRLAAIAWSDSTHRAEACT